MKINSINSLYRYNQNSSLGFKSKVAYVFYGTASDDLKNKVDQFEEKHDNAQFIGSGLFAKVYRLDGTNVVIKESLPSKIARAANGDFSQEAKALSRLPESVKNTQRLVANVKTERGNSYLLSTLVNGKKPEIPTYNWEQPHFNSLFRVLFELDKSGIMHGDLNRGNCLIARDGTTNLIDYQYADTFKFDDKDGNDRKYKNPDFCAPSNAQMFEMANLPYYLVALRDKGGKSLIRETFVSYLKEKVKYCQNRANYLRYQNANPEMIEYEQLQAKFLKNPSEEMIKLQALKLQVLYAFRQVFSVTDKNNESEKNIINTVPFYLYAAACAKKLMDYTEKIMRNNTTDDTLNKYLGYERKFGYYWRAKMLSELTGKHISDDGEYGAFKWIVRNAMLNPHWKNGAIDPDDDLSDKFKQSSLMEFGTIDDVVELITGQTDVWEKRRQLGGMEHIQNKFLEIDLLLKDAECVLKPSDVNPRDFTHINTLKNTFIDSYNQAFHAVDQQRLLASIPATIKALYNASLLVNATKKLYDRSNNVFTSGYAFVQNKLADRSIKNLYKIVNELCDRAITAINGYDSSLSPAIYYEKINEFDLTNCPKYDIKKELRFGLN